VLFVGEVVCEFEAFDGSIGEGPEDSIVGCETGSVRLSFESRVDGLADEKGNPVCCALFVGGPGDSANGICVLLGSGDEL
jgi:hypothetical protein